MGGLCWGAELCRHSRGFGSCWFGQVSELSREVLSLVSGRCGLVKVAQHTLAWTLGM